MSSFWTVAPNQVDRKELEFKGRTFSIDLKQELTSGERARIEASAFKSYTQRRDTNVAEDDAASAMDVNVNLELAKFEKQRVWLTAWSLTDDGNQPLPLTIETLRALKDGVGEVIDTAIDKHAKEVREAAKKPEAPAMAQSAPGRAKISS